MTNKRILLKESKERGRGDSERDEWGGEGRPKSGAVPREKEKERQRRKYKENNKHNTIKNREK